VTTFFALLHKFSRTMDAIRVRLGLGLRRSFNALYTH